LKNRLRYMLGRHPEDNAAHLHFFSPAAVRALLHGFAEDELTLGSSRFNRLHSRLMASIIVFAATAPDA
jgi:hypothetical protein